MTFLRNRVLRMLSINPMVNNKDQKLILSFKLNIFVNIDQLDDLHWMKPVKYRKLQHLSLHYSVNSDAKAFYTCPIKIIIELVTIDKQSLLIITVTSYS